MGETAVTNLADLIARVEAAKGPDPFLDVAIARAEGWHETEHAWMSPEMHARQADTPRYTASLDAAVSLVPEGFFWCVNSLSGRHSQAWCSPRGANPRADAAAATPALALCAAALRARMEARDA